MKRFIRLNSLTVLLVLGLILFSTGVFAASCSSESQTILSLYGTNNTHGALWNVSQYQEKVCFDEIFGHVYGGENPHACTGNNKVVKLTSYTNAHAYSVESNYNNVDVCYGNLVCSTKLSCGSDEKEVVSLFNTTNSHLAVPGYYSYKVCCYELSDNPFYWADMAGNRITHADVGDSVMMVALIPGAIDETGMTFDVFKNNDILADSEIRSLDTYAKAGKAAAIWKITNEDYAKAGNGDNYDFYFKVNGGSYSGKSNDLKITKQESNSAPVAVISSPWDKCAVFTGDQVIFNQSSYDVDDLINLSWSIDDTLDPDLVKASSFSHIYTTGGQKDVRLTVTDSRGLASTNKVSILVIGATAGFYQIYPYISNPLEGQIIIGNKVDFDGSDSFVIRSNGSCVGGNCPTQLKICPHIGSSSQYMAIDDSNNKKGDYSMFNFSWTFGDDPATPLKIEGSGLKSGTRYYGEYGNREIALEIGIGGASSKAENKFVLVRASGCYSNGNSWYDNSNKQSYSTSLPNICMGADNKIGGGDDCCPIGKICTAESDGAFCEEAGCVSSYVDEGNESEITLCDHYNYLDENIRQTQCEADCNAAWNSEDQKALNVNLKKSGYTADKCVWKNDECRLQTKKITVDPNDGRIIDDQTCIVSSDDGICIDGVKIISYTSSCGEIGSVEASCSSSPIKLPFFGIFNFIISVIFIAGVYGILKRDD